MSLIEWRAKGDKVPVPRKETLDPTLDPSFENSAVVSRTFSLDDLLVSRVSAEENLFLLSFKLQRVGLTNSGNNQNPVPPPLFLSLKAEGKELALLSGLLKRQVEIEEERSVTASQAALQNELQRLREENQSLSHENKVLKNSLMELHRPRSVS